MDIWSDSDFLGVIYYYKPALL